MAAHLRSWLGRQRPRPMNMSGPLVQLFFNDATRTTTFTFANFPSLYAPQGAKKYRYVIEGRGPDGAVLGRRTITVPVYGATAIAITDLFGSEIPSWGTIHVKLRAGSLLNRKDQHLGVLTPHFYALFHARDMRSLALVHPQTEVCEPQTTASEWRSSLLLDTELSESFEIFQLNPTAQPVTSELRVHNEHGEVLASAASEVPAFGVTRQSWGVRELRDDPRTGRWVALGADRLAAPNAKPLVFITNRAGLVSGSHS